MNVTIPRFCLASSTPEGDTFVVSSHDPVMIARVEPRGMIGFRLHCWPAEVQKRYSESQIFETVKTMADIFAAEVEQMPGLPSKWDFVFDEKMVPPCYLLCDDVEGESFTAILRLKEPRLWMVFDENDTRKLHAVCDPEAIASEKPLTTEEAQHIMREGWEWWKVLAEAMEKVLEEEDEP